MTTYNHEKYVQQAVDSILSQKVNFRYEVIIGDDASTDETQRILLDNYSNDNRVKLILRKENLNIKSEGPTNGDDIRTRAVGKYIRFAEGDDFWLDDKHLQRMVDWLECHEEYVAVSGRRLCLSERTGYLWINYNNATDNSEVNMDSYLKKPNGVDLMATLIRNYYNDGCYEYRDYLYSRKVGDITLMLQILLHGLIYQMPDIVGVYRTDRVKWASAYNVRNGPLRNFENHIELLDKLKKDCYGNIEYKDLYIKYTRDYLNCILTVEELDKAEKYLRQHYIYEIFIEDLHKKRDEIEDSLRVITQLKNDNWDQDEKLKLAIYWIKNKGKIKRYLLEHNITKICVYGMRYFGDCLIDELRESRIKIVGIIDKRAETVYAPGYSVFYPDDALPDMDALVVTAIISFDKVRKDMSGIVNVPIISLARILYD